MTEAKTNTRFPSLWGLLLTAWGIALVSTLVALFIGEVTGKTPCTLCWFQRAFMFPLVVILAVGCYISDFGVWRYALPVTVVGWFIALYHSLLYLGVIPESIKPCGAGPSCSSADMMIFGSIPLPLLSLGAFTLIAVLLVLIRRRSSL